MKLLIAERKENGRRVFDVVDEFNRLVFPAKDKPGAEKFITSTQEVEKKLHDARRVEKTPREFEEALEGFLKAVNSMRARYFAKTSPKTQPAPVTAMPGRNKYTRIMAGDDVYCFVECSTGNVLKAASYKIPVRINPRSNIYDDDHGLSGVTPTGTVYLK